MSRLPTIFLALLLAISPLMAEAGTNGHVHHGSGDHAPAGHAGESAGGAAASADEDCEDATPDHCCGDTGVACTATYLFGDIPADAALTAATAPQLLGRESDPDTLHPESDPPPPRT